MKIDRLPQLIENVNQNIQKGNIKAANFMLSLLAELHPTNVDVLILNAKLKFQSISTYSEGIPLVQRAILLSTKADTLGVVLEPLKRLGLLDAVEKIIRIALKKWPNSHDLYNMLSSILKDQKRLLESIDAAKTAISISPNNYQAWMNLGIGFLLYQKYEEALEAFTKAVEFNKTHIALHLKAGAYISMEKYELAQETLEEALLQKPGDESIIIDLCATYYNRSDYDTALKIVTVSLMNNPNSVELLKTKAVVLRQMGKVHDTIVILEQVLKANPKDLKSWIFLGNAYYHALGNSIKARECYNKAYALDPENRDIIEKLCTFLQEVREGSVRDNVDTSYKLACKLIDITPNPLLIAGAAQPSLLTVLDYDTHKKLGPYHEIIKKYVSAFQMSRVKTLEDRLAIIDTHIKKGTIIELGASKKPLIRKVRQRLNNKIRLGILSSDLRHHPVGYFAWPILEYTDKTKFEVYCYSAFPYEPDHRQKQFMAISDKFVTYREESIYEIAQSIHDDQLDMLFELGGSTLYSKLDVCAYKPAPLQASWLGYPHSIGLPTTIDYILVDPYLKPDDPRLLIEKPFLVPETWVSIHEISFPRVKIETKIPYDKNGYITFGTMNAAHKFNPTLFEVWASIMNKVPNSKILYVRLETDSPILKENFCKHMESHGISRDRVMFRATNDHHLPFYNEIDIAFDTFPHTGGTTTCETLWMGVPVVTLVGPAMFERLSYSNISNAGLKDLCTFTTDEYQDKAVALANDLDRLRYLRLNLRNQIKDNPLGRPEDFVNGFCKTLGNVLGVSV